jgi:hypothetical protein
VAWFVIVWLNKNECIPTGAAIVHAKSQRKAFERAIHVDSTCELFKSHVGSFHIRKISAKEAKKLMLKLAD